jgi:hypothetical protein
MEKLCKNKLHFIKADLDTCPYCSSSASSACSGEDARQADKASAVTQRSGDEAIADVARWAWRCLDNPEIEGVDHVFRIEGYRVRIQIDRRK